jgi:hypothetical protein
MTWWSFSEKTKSLLGDLVGDPERLGGVGGVAGDDQRGASLVDQDRVDLVDDGEVAPALLDLGGRLDLHVVAQVVEAELVVGAVGDVRGVGLAPVGVGHVGLDATHGQAEELHEGRVEVPVALGQVVVDRDHVHAATREGVEVGGQRGHQGLALTGDHLGDPAAVEGHAADELDVVVTLAHGPLAGFADDREGLADHPVEDLLLDLLVLVLEDLGVVGLSVHGQAARLLEEGRGVLGVELLLDAGAELGGLGGELFVGEGRGLLLEGVDLGDDGQDLAHEAVVAAAKHPRPARRDGVGDLGEGILYVFEHGRSQEARRGPESGRYPTTHARRINSGRFLGKDLRLAHLWTPGGRWAMRLAGEPRPDLQAPGGV